MQHGTAALAVCLTTLTAACTLESGDIEEPSVAVADALGAGGASPTALSRAPVVCTAGEPAPCDQLSAHFSKSLQTAVCRPNGTGWDVSACEFYSEIPRTIGDVRDAEVVRPAKASQAPQHWKDARCNDGKAFDMQVRLAPKWSPQRDRWLIYLRGGGMCDDDASLCSDRKGYVHPHFFGKNVPKFAPFDRSGVLSANHTKNEPFAHANQVFMDYCSSDLWSGSSPLPHHTTYDPDHNPNTKYDTYFTGRINVIAGIEILIQRFGLDDSNPATEVLFGGFSAGGHGVHGNARVLAEYLPATAAARRIRLLADAAWIPEWEPSNSDGWQGPDADSFPRGMKNAYSFWDSALDSECEAAQPHGEQYRCFFGKHVYPYLSGPVASGGLNLRTLEAVSLHDVVYTEIAQLITIDPQSQPPQPHYQIRDSAGLDAWGDQMEAELSAVDSLGTQTQVPVPWVFSVTDHYHALSDQTWKMGYGPEPCPSTVPSTVTTPCYAGDPNHDHLSFRHVLYRFFRGMPAERVIMTDSIGSP